MTDTVHKARAALRAAESAFNEMPAAAPRAMVDHAIRRLNDAKADYCRAWQEERRRFHDTRQEYGRRTRQRRQLR
ncbi:MAG TPA: hypothetical protein GX716_06000 [Firmicutes bacterium]|nr:hypothetical protein [Candidatus Fermentithermobacillaceae bacterium]